MQRDIIADKDMDFCEGNEDTDGSFWAGLDEIDGCRFELMFTADKDGPTADQITKYDAFVTSYSRIRSEVESGAKSQLLSSDPELYERVVNAGFELSIVTVRRGATNPDIEFVGEMYYKKFIFRKGVSIGAKLTDNKVTSLEVFRTGVLRLN